MRNLKKPEYTEVLEVQGIKIPFIADVISPRMKGVIERGKYERNEILLLRKILRPRDRILELGGGVGAVSTAAALSTKPQNIVTVEANPGLIPVIRETHALNGVEGIRVLNGVGIGMPSSTDATFYLHNDFWASSLEEPREDKKASATPISVPQIDLNALIKEHKPSVFVADIEGGELDLLPTLDLSSCRAAVIELHPGVYGLEGIARCFDALRQKGFAYDAKKSRGGTVVVFSRIARARKTTPKITAITCMKDEGPFILEWIAYHKMIGITDFLIFTNDCSDGTTEILDRLDTLGHVRHLPNMSMVVKSPRHQIIALYYAMLHREVRDADWIISMDVDEFINVHIGDRTLGALIDANPEANVISLCHLDFGCSGIEQYQDDLLIHQMKECTEKYPADNRRRGIKTLIKNTAPPYTISNHRPHFDDPTDPSIVWIDGGGHTFSSRRRQGKHMGMPPKGAYEQVQLNHYPTRSVETYLTKSVKGNVIAIDSFVGVEYWNKRNGRGYFDDTIAPLVEPTRKQMSALLSDPVLSELHQKAVSFHKKHIAELRSDPSCADLLRQIKKSHES